MAPEIPSDRRPFLSVCVPARDESASIGTVLDSLHWALERAGIPHEIVVECSGSVDDTRARALARVDTMPLRVLEPTSELGFGNAVRRMLDHAMGDVMTVVMGDGCEDPADIVRCYRRICRPGVDAVFGSRFMTGGRVHGYPRFKRLANRVGNRALSLLYRCPHDDLTNGFKFYKRSVLDRLPPLRSTGFGITVELALGIWQSGARVVRQPISWSGAPGHSRFSVRGYVPVLVRCIGRRRVRAG